MARKLAQLVLVASIGLGLLAFTGCGSDSKKSSGSEKTATPAAETPTAAATQASGDGSSDPNIKAAVDACKNSINAQPQLSAKLKSDLVKICDKAASGDVKGAQEATKEVCTKIVQEMVPAGAAQDQALAACKKTAP